MYSAIQVRTAARPTRLWKAATSCGKSEISIRLAMVSPAGDRDIYTEERNKKDQPGIGIKDSSRMAGVIAPHLTKKMLIQYKCVFFSNIIHNKHVSWDARWGLKRAFLNHAISKSTLNKTNKPSCSFAWMHFVSHLSSCFHKLPFTCRTFTCDDKIHWSLYVDKMIDVMVQISKEFKLFKDWGRHVQH